MTEGWPWVERSYIPRAARRAVLGSRRIRSPLMRRPQRSRGGAPAGGSSAAGRRSAVLSLDSRSRAESTGGTADLVDRAKDVGGGRGGRTGRVLRRRGRQGQPHSVGGLRSGCRGGAVELAANTAWGAGRLASSGGYVGAGGVSTHYDRVQEKLSRLVGGRRVRRPPLRSPSAPSRGLGEGLGGYRGDLGLRSRLRSAWLGRWGRGGAASPELRTELSHRSAADGLASWKPPHCRLLPRRLRRRWSSCRLGQIGPSGFPRYHFVARRHDLARRRDPGSPGRQARSHRSGRDQSGECRHGDRRWRPSQLVKRSMATARLRIRTTTSTAC